MALDLFTKVRIVVPTIGAALPVVPIILFASQFDFQTAPGVVGFSLILGLAAAIVGALLGFLFGVPRYARDTAGPTLSEIGRAAANDPAQTSTLASIGWHHNTNLEQVSDWLTKILVGVGLTQFRSIGEAVGTLLQTIRPGLGDVSSSAAFGGFLLAYFGAIGFIVGYIFTVAYLPGVLAERHRRFVDKMAGRDEVSRTA